MWCVLAWWKEPQISVRGLSVILVSKASVSAGCELRWGVPTVQGTWTAVWNQRCHG
jgi:hypothetical protein